MMCILNVGIIHILEVFISNLSMTPSGEWDEK